LYKGLLKYSCAQLTVSQKGRPIDRAGLSPNCTKEGFGGREQTWTKKGVKTRAPFTGRFSRQLRDAKENISPKHRNRTQSRKRGNIRIG